jgi:putative spermidine/putrescine transport system permease protein
MSVNAGALGQTPDSTLVNGPAQRPSRAPRNRPKVWKVVIYLITILIFLVPLACSIKYALLQKNQKYGFGNFTLIFSDHAIRNSVYLSLELAAIVSAAGVILLVPTAVLVRLKLPKLSILMDGVTLMPFVVPPIVIAAGMFSMKEGAPLWYDNLLFNHNITTLAPVYLALATPLFYRMLDIGLKSIDLHTLVDASRSLGHGWTSTLVRVVIPNIQTALLGAIFLTIAMVLGELVIADQFSINTFPVQMITASAQLNAPGVPVALALLAFGFTFLLLFLLTFLARRRGQSIGMGIR